MAHTQTNTYNCLKSFVFVGVFLSAVVYVISTEVTYVLGGLVFAWIVEEAVWDYAITVTLLHVGLTIAGKCSFVWSDGD